MKHFLKRWIFHERRPLANYSLALLLSIFALMIHSLLFPLTGLNLLFISTAFIVATSTLAGKKAGMLTTLITGIGLNISLVENSKLSHFETREDFLRIGAFISVGLILSWVGGSLRKSVRVTQLALNEAREATRAKDEFISIIAHELRNPLTALKLQTELAQRKSANTDSPTVSRASQERLILTTAHVTQRLLQLIDDLLDFSRASHGNLKIVSQTTDLSSVTARVLEQLSAEFSSRKIVLSAQIPQEVLCECDPNRMEQVLLNLLSNAIKYGNGKPVGLHVEKVGHTVRITVSDHGPGIATENLERIFDRFQRVDESVQISGMGLGLYITRKIVELHHGQIWAESTVGEGTRFVAIFPVNERNMPGLTLGQKTDIGESKSSL